MHELSFVKNSLEKIEGMKKEKYTIRIPEYHDVEEFREILKSFLKDKKLKIRIEKVSVVIRCLDCKYEGQVRLPFSMVKIKPRCPKCKSIRTEMIQGEDIEVV